MNLDKLTDLLIGKMWILYVLKVAERLNDQVFWLAKEGAQSCVSGSLCETVREAA